MSYSLAVFNKSAFKPYLPASATVPFLKELVHGDPEVGKNLAEFRFNNRAPSLISSSSLTLRGTFPPFSFVILTPCRFSSLCEKKLLQSPNLQGGCL